MPKVPKVPKVSKVPKVPRLLEYLLPFHRDHSFLGSWTLGFFLVLRYSSLGIGTGIGIGVVYWCVSYPLVLNPCPCLCPIRGRVPRSSRPLHKPCTTRHRSFQLAIHLGQSPGDVLNRPENGSHYGTTSLLSKCVRSWKVPSGLIEVKGPKGRGDQRN